MNIAHELMEIARLDLAGAKILYKEKLYPQSVFLFQQSVEKAYKAMGLLLGELKEEDLGKSIRHDVTKINKKIFKKGIEELKESLMKSEEILKEHPEFKNLSFLKDSNFIDGIEEYKKSLHLGSLYFEKDEEKIRKLIYIPSREIRSIIEEIENEKEEYRKKNVQKRFFQNLKHFKETTSEMCERKFGNNPEEAVRVKKAIQDFEKILGSDDMKEYLKTILELFSVLIPTNWILFRLAELTSPHSIISRYPESYGSPKIYTKRLPLIKMLPELMGLQDDALRRLKRGLPLLAASSSPTSP